MHDIYFTFYDYNQASAHHKLDGLGNLDGDSQVEFCCCISHPQLSYLPVAFASSALACTIHSSLDSQIK